MGNAMNKKIPLGAAIAFMVVVAGITFCITMMVSLNHFNTMVLNVKEREEVYKKLADVDRESRQRYAGQINEDTLSDSISRGYVRGLGDAYSTYLTKDEYEEQLQEKNGQRVSIGITLEEDQSNYVRVKKVTEDSPAEQGGLMAGDLLISIDGTDMQTVSLSAAERLLKGQPGTKMTIVYRRDGVDTTQDFQRKELEVSYVEYRMLDGNGYIRILDFNDNTYAQFRRAADDLIRQGASGLIFDVRDNTSDSVDAAADVLDMLLPSGVVGTVVSKGTSGDVTKNLTSDRYEVALPMVVLINGKTGCAAEFFAAGLREFKTGGESLNRAQTVGVQTLGKSSIQELLPLTDGSALSLTTAHFLTPEGTDVSAVGGIKPDYEVKLSADQMQFPDLLTDVTDPQLKKALEVVNSQKIA